MMWVKENAIMKIQGLGSKHVKMTKFPQTGPIQLEAKWNRKSESY